MATNLAALIFAILGIALAVFLFPKMLDKKWGMRLGLTWAGLAVCAFLSPNDLFSFVLIAIMLATLAPRAANERVCFFIAMLPALPIYYEATVPFPGLNYLIDINFGLVSILVVLAPTLFMKVKTPAVKKLSLMTLMVFSYIAVISLLDFRVLPFTSVLRSSFTNLVTIGITYLAVVRSIQTKADFDMMVRALLASIIFIASIGLVSFVREWNFYTQLYQGDGFVRFADYRFGIRVQSTLMTTLVGYMMGLGVVITYHFMALRQLKGMQAISMIILFIFILLVSGSRGAYLSAFMMFTIYGAYRTAPGIVRMFMFPSVSLVIFILLGWLNSGRIDQLTSVDQYGTFEYRVQLLRASLKQIRENFFFGASDFIESPNFVHLVQGQGIVDIVNTYLQVALEFGVVALFLFVTPFVIAVRSLSRQCAYSARFKDEDNQLVSKLSAVLIAGIAAYLLMILSVSDRSYLIHYGFILMALGKAYSSVCLVRKSGSFQTESSVQVVV